jgi:hypothetical protein
LTYISGQEVGYNDISFEVGNPLSIGKDEIESFSLYPNPVNNGNFSISTGDNSLKLIQLYDVVGEMVLRKAFKIEKL